MAIEGLLGNLKDIEARHIEEIMVALTKPAGKRLNLPGGLVFAIEYKQYLLGLDPAALSPFPAIENEFVRITFNPDGTLNILDKESGLKLKDAHYFEDCADAGDEYDFSEVGGDKALKSKKLNPWNKGKHWSAEMKKKFSEISKSRYLLNPNEHPNRKCAGIKESYPEKMLREYFELKGLIKEKDFNQQYPIKGYFTDFYIPKLNLVIEVDGEYWHRDIEKEEKRENIIKEHYNIRRFNAAPLIKKEYQKEIDEIISSIFTT
jgi:very-short-patch-repair endonuclease